MIRSVWRYSHFLLALVASLFLLVATLTGLVLATETISKEFKAYTISDWEEIPLGTTIQVLKDNYEEVLSLEVEPSGFIKTSVLNADFESLDVYVNPETGHILGEIQPRPAIYQFAITLHRSLFLKSTGRLVIGIVAFLLCLIVISGIGLTIQRQGGVRHFFNKIRDRQVEQRYHILLSRWFMLPILIIGLSGVYLTAETFKLVPEQSSQKREVAETQSSTTYESAEDLPVFQEIKLGEVREVEFPFSSDPEDYYRIALKDRKIEVNQQTGAVVSQQDYPFVALVSNFNKLTHTGRGSTLWSVVLFLSCLALLFFIYSGFAISLKNRRKSTSLPVMIPKDEAEYIILFGSQTGTTYAFARQLYDAFDRLDQKVFMAPLNNYTTYAKAKQILVLAATYGKGDAPTNARKFEQLVPGIHQNPVNFAVVGFGSLQYPDYCEFAISVDNLLQKQPSFNRSLKVHKVNDQSRESFHSWVHALGDKTGIPLQVKSNAETEKPTKQVRFKVLHRSAINADSTFTLQLKPRKRVSFQSGDLLAIIPEGQGNARQYSIARIGKKILLSVKLHENGCCSPYLSKLQPGDTFKATIETNTHFHLPAKNAAIFMVANGTGIAPFLGMLHSKNKRNINLLWGCRTEKSLEIYKDHLDRALGKNRNVNFTYCQSRGNETKYVQQLVYDEGNKLIKNLEEGGTLMLCGSLAMQRGVLKVLEDLLHDGHSKSLSHYEANNQIKMDCY